VWIGFVIRDGQLVPVRGSTVLRAGDEILALADPERTHDSRPSSPAGGARTTRRHAAVTDVHRRGRHGSEWP